MGNLFYGNAFDYMKSIKDRKFDCVITDPPYDMGYDDRHWLMDELERISKGNIVVFCSPENPLMPVPDERAYWIKTPSTKNYSKHLGRFVELILIRRRGNTFNSGLHWSNYTGVYTDMVEQNDVHPYVKPLSLIKRMVSIYSKINDTVFDPFFGSGTVLAAAKELSRRPHGCEIKVKYYRRAQRLYGT